MISLGITNSGARCLLNQHAHNQSVTDATPDRIVFGIDIADVLTHRMWLDAALQDEERFIFLRHKFSVEKHSYLDYEVITHDQGRALLHVYVIKKEYVLNKISLFNLNACKIIGIETSLHALGRALMHDVLLSDRIFQCLSVFDDHLELSFHENNVVLYYQSEPIRGPHDTVCAIRRILMYYQNDYDYRGFTQLFFLMASPLIRTESFKTLNLSMHHVCISYDTYHTLIPYGLALRGCND